MEHPFPVLVSHFAGNSDISHASSVLVSVLEIGNESVRALVGRTVIDAERGGG